MSTPPGRPPARRPARTGANGTRIVPNGSRARGPKRRDREVLETAAEVFYRQGYADTSVQDIADALGILKGSLYHYIKTKEDLLYRLLDEVHQEVGEILDEASAAKDLDPLERLTLYVRRQVEFNATNVTRVSVYYHDVEHLGDERRNDIFRRRKQHERFVTRLIRDAQACGEADPSLNAAALTRFVFGSVIWVYRWYRPNGRMSVEELAHTCTEFVLRGIAGRLPDRA